MSPRKTKGHRNGYFTTSWSSGSTGTTMLKHSLCSGMSISLELYHHLPLFQIASPQMAKAKRFYTSLFHRLCLFKQVFKNYYLSFTFRKGYKSMNFHSEHTHVTNTRIKKKNRTLLVPQEPNQPLKPPYHQR